MSQRARLGLVALGQTPRPDLELEFRRLCNADITIVGALDGLEPNQIASLNDPDGHYPLHTKLANGSLVDIPLERMIPLVSAGVDALEDTCNAIVVLCAGAFPQIPAKVPVILPGRITLAVAGALCPTAKFAVLVPNRGQVDEAASTYRNAGLTVSVGYASPFVPAEIARAARGFTDPSLQLIVIDCIGHGRQLQKEIGRLSGRPTILAQTLVARAAAEVLQGLTSPTQYH